MRAWFCSIIALAFASGCSQSSPSSVAAPTVNTPTTPQWNCPYPPEADAKGIDFGEVTLEVVVSTTGVAKSVRIVSDPGYGFGEGAVHCIRARQFTPRKDAAGRPVEAALPVRFRFQR